LKSFVHQIRKRFRKRPSTKRQFIWPGAALCALFVVAAVYLGWKTQSGVQHTGWAFGKKLEIRVWANYVSRPAQLHLANVFFRRAKALESTLWLKNASESSLAVFNRASQTHPLAVPAEIPELLARLAPTVRAVEGVVDPTLKPLQESVWPSEDPERIPASLEDSEITDMPRYLGLDKLKWEFDPPTLQKSHPSVYLDFEPWFAAAVAEELEQRASIEKGTAMELQTEGLIHFWKSHPIPVTEAIRQTLERIGVSDYPKTSGAFAWLDFVQVPSQRSPGSFLQLVDSRKLSSAQPEISAVAVFCRNPLNAVTWSRAAMVLGTQQLMKLADKHDVPVRVRTLQGRYLASNSWERTVKNHEDSPSGACMRDL
jgi:thiamine biosynthesis lipoprotein ApbE